MQYYVWHDGAGVQLVDGTSTTLGLSWWGCSAGSYDACSASCQHLTRLEARRVALVCMGDLVPGLCPLCVVLLCLYQACVGHAACNPCNCLLADHALPVALPHPQVPAAVAIRCSDEALPDENRSARMNCRASIFCILINFQAIGHLKHTIQSICRNWCTVEHGAMKSDEPCACLTVDAS